MIFRISIMMLLMLAASYTAMNPATSHPIVSANATSVAKALKEKTAEPKAEKKSSKERKLQKGPRYTCTPSGAGMTTKCWPTKGR